MRMHVDLPFRQRLLPATMLLALAGAAMPNAAERQALFGDLHIHTRLSTDAWGFGTRTSPDDAYRFAKGESIPHPAGYDIQLPRPLDFYAVTDHGEFLGIMSATADPNHPLSEVEGAERFTGEMTYAERLSRYRQHWAHAGANRDLAVIASAWRLTVEAAERHYEPGVLTTFAAYEYTSAVGGNLHRNVFFLGSEVPERPFSRVESPNPEDLWAWMDDLRAEGIDTIAIPHNPNGSNGRMFEMTTFGGKPLDGAYAETRMRNEPLVEVTQIKGTSDTHPFLSPDDEWADFEISPYRIARWALSNPAGSYVRDAYLRGLRLADNRGFNPYRFGLVGASDSHNAGATFDESNFSGKIGVFDGTPKARGSVPVRVGTDDEPAGFARNYYARWGASGLAGVWAEENTRESIFAAFRRKETFATTGPRIAVRFFAGYGFPDDLDRPTLVDDAYGTGVPMGGELVATKEAPEFLVLATADPHGAPLQRAQVIKGWIEGGEAREQVFDVACSDGLLPDPRSHRCPDNGATVDLADCSTTADVGAMELKARWQDPGFDPDARAFYYVRVLENPTCRWSTWDAIRAGTPRRRDLPATIQERAWASPIWVALTPDHCG